MSGTADGLPRLPAPCLRAASCRFFQLAPTAVSAPCRCRRSLSHHIPNFLGELLPTQLATVVHQRPNRVKRLALNFVQRIEVWSSKRGEFSSAILDATKCEQLDFM